ncbi:MAG: hypothetical protein IKC32_03645 [Clostridia bacterium]|nr:hypothetical protein [Clostridia bacterium]
MKRILISVLSIISMLLCSYSLASCQSDRAEDDGGDDIGAYAIFGTVAEVGSDTLLVEDTKGVAYRVALADDAKCYDTSGSEIPFGDIAFNNKVKVYYNGMVTRSIPAGITAGRIDLIADDEFFDIVKDMNPVSDVTDSFYMTARVVEVGEKLEVEVIASEYAVGTYLVNYSSATPVIGVDGERISASDIKVGATVEISYTGQTMMSLPPQIIATRIEVK